MVTSNQKKTKMSPADKAMGIMFITLYIIGVGTFIAIDIISYFQGCEDMLLVSGIVVGGILLITYIIFILPRHCDLGFIG